MELGIVEDGIGEGEPFCQVQIGGCLESINILKILYNDFQYNSNLECEQFPKGTLQNNAMLMKNKFNQRKQNRMFDKNTFIHNNVKSVLFGNWFF